LGSGYPLWFLRPEAPAARPGSASPVAERKPPCSGGECFARVRPRVIILRARGGQGFDNAGCFRCPAKSIQRGGLLRRTEGRESRSRRHRGQARVAVSDGEGGTEACGRALRWLLVVILLLGFGLRLYELDGKALWYDELGTALYTSTGNSLLEVVRQPLQVPVIPAPPIYFISTYCLRLVSQGNLVLRLPSVFFGVLAICAIYALGKALLGRRQGLVAAFLLSISAFHIRYSQEARYYALLMLLGTLSLYFFYRGLRRNDVRSWSGYVVSSTLAAYTHLFAFLFLAVEALFALLLLLLRRLGARPAAGARTWRTEPVFSYLASALLMALLYLPMLPFTLGGILGGKGLGGRVPIAVDRTSLTYLAGIVDLFGAGPGIALLCYLAALAVGVYLVLRRQHRLLVLLSMSMVLPFLVVFLVPTGHSFRLRYVIFVLPVFLIVVSTGLVGLADLISRWLAKKWAGAKMRAMAGAVTLAVFCSILGVLSLGALEELWNEGKQPWDKASSFLQVVVGSSEVVVATGEDYAARLLYYGYDASDVRYLASCPCPSRAVLEDWHRFIGVSVGYDRVWLLDPNPSYRQLRPGGPLAKELESHVFLPPVVFKGRGSSSVVERDLLAPFATSDINVLLALPADPIPSNGEIIEMGTNVARQADELFPQDTRYHFTLGELHRFYGTEEEAVKQYEAAIAGDPDYYSAYEGLAIIYVARGEPQRALELYQGLLARGVIQESDYHFLVGSLAYFEGDTEEAAHEFAQAVRMDGDNVEYRFQLGEAYRTLGRYAEAMGQYEEVTRLDPSYVGAYARRATIYRAEGLLDEAVGEYQMTLELRPDSAFYHAMLADTYRYQGLLQEAAVEAEEAVRLGEGEAAYHVLLGEVYQALERIPEAIAEFEIGVQLAPDVAPYYLELGDAYTLAGRDEEAIAAYERVVELDPGNATALRALDDLGGGRTHD
jgi:mannosyltransferase